MKLSNALTTIILATITSEYAITTANRDGTRTRGYRNHDQTNNKHNKDKNKDKGSKSSKGGDGGTTGPPYSYSGGSAKSGNGGNGGGGGGKPNRSSKSSKGGDSNHGGGGKIKLDECVFANPTIELTNAFMVDAEEDEYDEILEHSGLVNGIYSTMVADWFEGKTNATAISKAGENIGTVHESLFENQDEQDGIAYICKLTHSLIEQMGKTCYFEKYESSYANVAANLMAGFTWGVGYDEEDLVIGDCENGESVSFMDMYGKMLTDDTKGVIMMM